MKILVTGAAGFIGFHLAKRLISEGFKVVGLDNLNDYYDVNLKVSRLKELGIGKENLEYGRQIKSGKSSFKFHKLSLEDKSGINRLFKEEHFDLVCNMAAQAGVRYSLQNPSSYVDSNIVGFMNILECCRNYKVKNLIYASSSSVYGLNDKIPFSEKDNVDHPISLYAATKKSNELMAHTYSHLFNFSTTGLRFFTVYGPWGRPDMALFMFTESILKGKPIKVFNNGEMYRDFTYIDDIIEGIYRVIDKKLDPDQDSKQKYNIYNIGNSKAVKLLDFIKIIEKQLGIKAKIELLPIQPGDLETTYADTEKLFKEFDYEPKTSLEEGVKAFVLWFKSYYSIYNIQKK